MRISLVSLDQKWLDKEGNFSECERYVEQSSENLCDVVVFPEMTLTGFAPDHDEIAEPVSDSETLKCFGSLAKRCGVEIVFGACLRYGDEKAPHNALCLARKSGAVEAVYTKAHLFSYANENRFLSYGDRLSIVQIGDFRVGLAICYDLRFPEMFSAMAHHCDAIMLIANWPARRVDHWQTLIRARAIENQCTVIGVNRIGSDGNGIEYTKSSIVVSPDGVLDTASKIINLMDIYDLSVDRTSLSREEFPTIKDKRFSFYIDLMRQGRE